MSERQFITAGTGRENLPPPRAETCYLCGLPVGPAGTGETASGSLRRFCCPGCRQVFLILSASTGDLPPDFRTTELYRACVEAGIVPGDAPSPSTADIPARETDTRPLNWRSKQGACGAPHAAGLSKKS